MVKKRKEIHGKPVVAPKKSLVIEVTDRHARVGNRKDWASCAFAQACKDVGYVKAAATLSRLYVETEDKVYVYEMPRNGRDQIIGFDRFENAPRFDPGTYEFSPLSPAKRRGGKQSADTNPDPNSTPRKHSRRRHVATVNVRGRFNPNKNW